MSGGLLTAGGDSVVAGRLLPAWPPSCCAHFPALLSFIERLLTAGPRSRAVIPSVVKRHIRSAGVFRPVPGAQACTHMGSRGECS
jgi:hypothetical protein